MAIHNILNSSGEWLRGEGPHNQIVVSSRVRLARNLNVTFVIVSHELASIYAIADRVIMLDKRRKGIIAEGDPRVLRDTSTDPRVHSFFNRTPQEATS